MGAIQDLSKCIENLSANTNILRKLLTKQNEWKWTEDYTNAFINIKEYIINIQCLAHYNAINENILTTDESTKGLGATLWQRQKDGNFKPVGFASRFLSDTEKKYAIIDLELLAVVWELKHSRLHIYGQQNKLLTDHQTLEQLIKRNRSNKTYSARLTRWLDRLAHFDIKIKHVAGKHMDITVFLSRTPLSNPEPIENYNKEYVFNCIITLFEFINNHGSVNESKMKESQTDHLKKSEKKTDQSQNRYQNKPKSSDGKTNKRSSLLLNQQKDSHINAITQNEIKMDYKKIEQLENTTQKQKHLP